MNRWQRRHGLGVASPQYSPDFHLNRPVKCVDCEVPLHKTHFFVFYGYRCSSCYDTFLQAQAQQAQIASHAALEMESGV